MPVALVPCFKQDHDVGMEEPCPLCTIEGTRSQLIKYINEFEGMKIAPRVDYTVEGISALADALMEARAYSERAAEIQGQSHEVKALARYSLLLLKEDNQNAYDESVQAKSARLSNLSWEERGSMYRLDTMRTLGPLREGERLMEVIDSKVKHIESLAWSLYHARQDLQAVVQTMRAGEVLGDLQPRE